MIDFVKTFIKAKTFVVMLAFAMVACVFGAFGVQPASAEAEQPLTVKAEANLSLGENIVLKTNLSGISSEYETATAKFTTDGKEKVVEATVSDGKAYFEYDGIMPNKFGVSTHIAFAVKGTNAETIVLEKDFSVNGYAAKLLTDYPDDAKLKKLVVDMYAYGEALKTYAGSGDTVLESVKDYGVSPSEFVGIEDPQIKKVNGKSDKLNWVSAALFFNYKVNVAFKFSGTFAAEPVLKVSKNGIEEEVKDLIKEENGGKTTYTGIYSALNLNEYATKLTAIVYDNGTKIEKTADYSVLSGIYSFSNDADESYKSCVQKVYNYCLSATEYHEAITNPKYTLTVRNADGVLGTYKLKAGEAFPAEAKDQNAIGYYNADDVREFGSIEEFTMPEKDFNLTFYYEDKTAAQKLIPGGEKVGDHKSKTVTIEGKKAIVDGKLGMLVSFSNAAGDFFRLLTACGAESTALGIQAGRTYKFDYTFVNYGEQTLKFKAIAVQTGYEMTEEKGAVISDEITLAKGEKKTVTLTIKLANKNKNAMLCIVCPEANADAKLGMTATKTNADASEHMHTLTLGDGVNATFENGLKTATVEWGGAMPKVVFSDASFTAGGWYEKDNEAVIFGKHGFIMPDRDITVLPLKESVGTVISFGYKHDNASNLTYDPATRKGSVVDGKKGEEITLVPTATGTAKIRFQSGFGSKKTLDGMTFHYIIENRGETKVKFTLYQVNAGTTLIAGAEAVVELEAGAVKSFDIKMPANGYSNNNALSYFVFTIDEAKPITLGISLSYEEIAE